MFFFGERQLHHLITAVPGGLPLALGLLPTLAGPSHPDSSMQLLADRQPVVHVMCLELETG